MEDFEKRVFDYTHRRKLYQSYETYKLARERGLRHFEDYELARQQLAYLRFEDISQMEQNLLAFEENFTRNGGKVIWAENAQEACEAIGDIIQAHRATRILKAKTATSDEIGLKAFLARRGLTARETDLGDFIVQALGEQASHFITPAQHLSKMEIIQRLYEVYPSLFLPDEAEGAELLATEGEEGEQAGEKPDDTAFLEQLRETTAEQLTEAVRKFFRSQYTLAEVGITGANFLVADIGAVAITENEGNARLLATFPKVHIAIAGIDKVIGSMQSLSLYWQMLAVNGTGQRLTAYNTLYTGAKKDSEADGTAEMYVVLLDNGRTKMLADSRLRHALRCVKCGACANACPVYRLVGGQAYESPYSGAIGKVVNPHLFQNPRHQEMTYASTLCGACEEVCPAQIDLPALIQHNREIRTQSDLVPAQERRLVRFWHKYMLQKKRWTTKNARWKNNALRHFFQSSWGSRQVLPTFAQESFHEQWTKKYPPA